MKLSHTAFLFTLLAGLSIPVHAGVSITSLTPSIAAPQPIGTVVTWTATATDTGAGPLTFQFNVTTPGGVKTTIIDYNVGTLSGGVWTSQPFAWFPTSCANVAQSNGLVAYTCQPAGGNFTVQVVAKDFGTNTSTSQSTTYKINPLVTAGKPVAVSTANPLVALFSSPGCATGSQMRAVFQERSQATPQTVTNYVACKGTSSTMTFEIAGMYPSDSYFIFAQTLTKGKTTNGPKIGYTTGPLPSSVSFPTYTVVTNVSGSVSNARMVLYDPHQFGGGPVYANTATDLSGKIMWYYATNPAQNLIIGRPLLNGTLLNIESGPNWTNNPALQILKQIDLAGNILRETNTGIIGNELVAMGATDAGPCSALPSPAPVGSGCLDQFHHDAIQSLPNGDTAVIASIEKILPAGTQGDTSGLPVDVVGDMIIVLNSQWQPIWYWDAFDPAGGGNGYPLMPVSQAAVLNETCGINQSGCGPMYLLGTGIAPLGKDWIHANSLYYWPKDQSGVKGQILLSSRNQDSVFKIDYQNGTGTGDMLWRMSKWGGSFIFDNVNADPWPWFSGQHDVGIENNGSGPISMFDNGNSRLAAPPIGLGSACNPNDCVSRGMVLTLDESTMTVTPVLSTYLGYNSVSGGNAQLMSNGNYFFGAVDVLVTLSKVSTFALEVQPITGTVNANTVLDIQTTEGYRAWRLTSFYNPPIT
ncbi:MAG TPA: aryl-sulfate sulfotransferase [Bryobacteraceae bacterium]|nr:aryl-sulfate sulfotransferase [Bryobacteraceae bacterium]